MRRFYPFLKPFLFIGIFILLLAFIPFTPTDSSERKTIFPASFSELDEKEQQLIKSLPPLEADWLFQDFGEDLKSVLTSKNGIGFLHQLQKISKQLPELSTKQKALLKQAENTDFETVFQTYLEFCKARRIVRLNGLITNSPEVVFLENKEFGNAPRLDMSMTDGPYCGKPFAPKAGIFKLRLNANADTEISPLHLNAEGMIRDLDVSFDGKRILFAQKENINEDWQIYEMNVAMGTTRQITTEKGIGNIQPCYLPDGILFHSTRCVTVVDCNETIDAVNIYRSDFNGKNIQRLTVDQVSTQFPALLPDGRVIYTRWEYNDRGQIFPQALFTMYPDGSHQSAFYGNNSWYPTSLIQASGIPGSNKVVCIIAGHHTGPMGKLALIDVGEGMEEGKGIELIAPQRKIDYKRVDRSEQEEQLFQYPHAINENEYLVSYSLFGKKSSQHFGIYWINKNGERELLAGDIRNVYRKPMLLAAREQVRVMPSQLHPNKNTGTFYVSNVYLGPGLEGVAPGTIKSLRVIALDFRASGIRTNFNFGLGGHARVNTPVSVGGAWDTKRILGEAKVHDDGSCYFEVPAYTPVYFQAIDQNGEAVQSMRSWSTLMPGESFSCIGCHDSKSTAPVNTVGQSMALKAGPSSLKSFYGINKGFSFNKNVQPILDKHCIDCHQGESTRKTFHANNAESPSYGLFSGYLANASVIESVYELPQKTALNFAEFNWNKQPENDWKLYAWENNDWKELRYSLVKNSDGQQFVQFKEITTTKIKLAVIPEKYELKLYAFNLLDKNKNKIEWGIPEKPFNLTGKAVDEPLSGRRWSEAYLRLIGADFNGSRHHNTLDAQPNDLVNWISPQSEPTMLKPYQTGASQSKLIKMLNKGHEKVKLSDEELDILRCWIDLAVPYVGTYDEANIWSDEEVQWFQHQIKKRERLSVSELEP